MSESAPDGSLKALDWLLEAGADEAMGETPVNRLAAKPPAPKAMPIPKMPVHGVAASPPPPAADIVTSAQQIAAACDSLAALKAALEDFDGGALKRGAAHTVFADGVPGAGIMFIGEGPGREEDEKGLPFVGRAGQLLDRMLAAIGLDRRTGAYITNVINWRAPGNRDPTPEEAAMCLPFLRRHIELAKPRLIVLLGAVAARHVMGDTQGIMRIRGHWMAYRLGEAMVPVLPTLHPAYLLRQPAHKKLAWRDLQALAEKMETLGLPEPATQVN